MICYLDGDGESLLEVLKTIPRGNHKHDVEPYSENKLIVYAKMLDSLKSHHINLRSYYADKIKMMINFK